MKKKGLITALLCMTTWQGFAQIYSGDNWTALPTVDLYDNGSMTMYARALAETAARREAAFEQYSEMAVEAFKAKQWNYVIRYVNQALETKYYNGYVYYLRGYAYEQLGNERAAKRDYKKGKRHQSSQAAYALDSLNEKQKQRRKK